MTSKQEKYLTEKFIRPMVKKMLREAKYEEPTMPQWSNDEGDKSEQFKAFRTWMNYQNQFSNIVRLLTDRSGYWYVGSSQQELQNKIKSMSPEQLKSFRSEVAALLQNSRIAQKAMNDVKAEANRLIQSLG